MAAAELHRIEADGREIAYRLRAGARPTLVFLPGYASDMEGTKALAIDDFAAQQGLGMLRLDYSGTGASAGRFEDGTLDRWLAEALAAIDRLTTGPFIVIGSSMGGWLALHIALARVDRTGALIGIAAAPDFTDWGFADGQAAGNAGIASGFWESGQRLRLLTGEIAVACPVRLVHGEHDRDVPLDVALRTLAALRSDNVQLKVIKGGGHRLSEPHEIEAILRTVTELLEQNI